MSLSTSNLFVILVMTFSFTPRYPRPITQFQMVKVIRYGSNFFFSFFLFSVSDCTGETSSVILWVLRAEFVLLLLLFLCALSFGSIQRRNKTVNPKITVVEAHPRLAQLSVILKDPGVFCIFALLSSMCSLSLVSKMVTSPLSILFRRQPESRRRDDKEKGITLSFTSFYSVCY